MNQRMCPRCGSYDLDNSGAQDARGRWTAICMACGTEWAPAVSGPFRRPPRPLLWWAEQAILISLIVLTIIAVLQWMKQ